MQTSQQPAEQAPEQSSPQPMQQASQQPWIAGFWRRIAALFIDAIILAIFGAGLALFFKEQFVQWGSWAMLLGFVVSFGYFSVMNSRLFAGQTLGKQAMNIRVVDESNQTLSLPRAMLRYLPLGIPAYLNGLPIGGDDASSFIIYPLSLIVIGGMFTIVYLYLFNRRTRQTLHDLVVGSYVVNCEVQQASVQTVWRPHYYALLCIGVLSLLVPAMVTSMVDMQEFDNLTVAQNAINSNKHVRYASVFSGSSTFTSSESGERTSHYIDSQAYMFENIVEDNYIAQQLAKSLVASYPESRDKDVIRVTMSYGYDIGIWSSWYNYTHSFNPIDIVSQLEQDNDAAK
ncbi:RDD family protein [Thalassotalea sp. Y01]|uniref:RDD family protein n=1 Tax=Thalassotalea sp. Y01 TaxID=2729613 RepID=UPI00145D6E5E|nr:RDD family protein [Thalassotalea sp. Y01]NMP17768.1 RDD family protein [Thalassotalea sp. Y01]